MVFNKPFGRYTLVKRIAMGGMAEVFLALRRGGSGFQRPFALKCILEHVNDDARHVEMFYNEARIGGLFQHPNLIPVFDVERIEGRHVMVMDFIAGQTVEELVKRFEGAAQKVEVPHAVSIVASAALGLAHAHSARELDGRRLNLVHRDISPANVLVGYDGSVRIFDFGVAVAAARADGAGELAGKAAYMSPEQCRGKAVDARSDVFSLGIVLHELVTGARLFKRENHIKTIRAITEDEIPAPSTLREGVPPELDAIILKALSRATDERYPNAMELHLALLQFMTAQGHVVEADDLVSVMTSTFREEIAELGALLTKAIAAPEQNEATVDLARFDVRTTRSTPAVPAPPRQSGKLPAVPPPITGAVPRTGNTGIVQAVAPPPPAPPTGIQTDQGDGLESLRSGAYVAAIEPPRSAPLLSDQAHQAVVARLDEAQKRNKLLMAAVVALAVVAGGAVVAAIVFRAPPPEPAAAAPTQATVAVRSEPSGAAVFVDGVARDAVTPTELVLDIGTPANVELRLDGYLPQTVAVTPVAGVNPAVERTLEVDRASQNAPIGTVRVSFAPADAQVYLDGTLQAGGSPLTLEGLRLNSELTLRFEKPGFETLYHTFTLDSGDILDVQLAMSEAVDLGRWNVRSEPAGARVLVDGVDVGATPLEGLELVANQTYTLELVRPGSPRYRVQRQVRAGDAEDIVVNLNRGERQPATPVPDGAAAAEPAPGTGSASAPERSPEPTPEPTPEPAAEVDAGEPDTGRRYQLLE